MLRSKWQLFSLVGCLTLSFNAFSFTFGYNADALQVLAEGDISKGFYQNYTGQIDKVELITRGTDKLYELLVTDEKGLQWKYRYNAHTGKLVGKQGTQENRFAYQ